MSCRIFALLNRHMCSLSSACGRSYDLHSVRSQFLAQTPASTVVDETVNCDHEEFGGKGEQGDGQCTKTEYLGWLPRALSSATDPTFSTFTAAHPSLTWPASHSEGCVGADRSPFFSSSGLQAHPLNCWVRSTQDLALQLALPEGAGEQFHFGGRSLLCSQFGELQVLGPPPRCGIATAGTSTPTGDQPQPFFNCGLQMPGLLEAGVPMEASSVKRKRKKKMNKHKQRKLRRRDRHRK